MAKESFFQEFTSIYTDKSINGWIRGIAWIGTAAVLYVVGDAVYIGVFPSKATIAAAQVAANLNNAIAADQASGITPTYPLTNYDGFASTIYNSGNSWMHLGDSFSVIESTLQQMQNNLDVELLMKSFNSAHSGTDLLTFVNAAFAAQWLGVVNTSKTAVNADWASKGITYQL